MTINDLYDTGITEAYRRKQLHAVPPMPVVSREEFLIGVCRGQVVLDIGASGPMHDGIVEVAKECWGIDHPDNDDGRARPGVFYIDLDRYDAVLPNRKVDVVVLGEVLEHLGNPGQFLDKLRADYAGTKTVITVPNAFSEVARRWMLQGIENVNDDHCCWFSPKTIRTLLERSGYLIGSSYWYNGQALLAEGLIVVAE